MDSLFKKLLNFILDEMNFNNYKVNATLGQISLILILSIFLCIILFMIPYLKTENSNRTYVYENSKISYEAIKPIQLNKNLDARKIELGEKLFNSPILSINDDLSCSTCHDLNSAGIPSNYNLVKTNINIPTIFNVSFNFKQFWDGRYSSLEDQISGQILNPESNSHFQTIILKIKDNEELSKDFKKIYKDGVSISNIKNSIVVFEESLVTPNSRFDKFLLGDFGAISESEKKGYQKFESFGCIHCHQGVNIGGNMFQKFGVYGNYFQDKGKINQYDFGLYNQTNNENDKFKFKVPSLRNIAVTSPYLHDGSIETLEETVYIMGKYQLGKTLSKEDINSIVSFLKTLTGEYKGKSL